MDKYKCQTITTLNWQNDFTAKDLLTKASKMVQPIMIKHKLQITTLSEFFPSNPSLQGMNTNKGEKVEVRCREPSDQTRFYTIDYIVGTLLHELCHNVHGPHNSEFYKLLDQFNNELDEFQSKNIEGTGAGFDAPGKVLDNQRHNPTKFDAKLKAADAAEKRLQLAQLMGKGKIGGTKTNLTPREAAAKAAERRFKDAASCGTLQ